MILLWGGAADGPFEAVREALEAIGAPVFALEQTRSAETKIELLADGTVSGAIRVGVDECDLAAVSAVYVRSRDSRSVTPDAKRDEALAQHADQLDALMAAFLDVTGALVINPVEAMASNGSKPYQLALIAAHGFMTPDTLVTTDPWAATEFAARHGQVVYKSVSGVRSIVARLRREDADRLADIAWCPTQFQQYVAGRDYRVHIVGEQVFAAEIESDADDYRYAAQAGKGVSVRYARIPASVEERCRSLAAALGLAVAGIDLRLTPEGDWHCFEVNPSPAFTYYEWSTGQPIAHAIAKLLARGRCQVAEGRL
jgi:glutathione synthase/RimK-type ligase-like ATP-grasp enzyme